MLNEQDQKDIKLAGKETGQMKAKSEAGGFVKIPKDGMKEARNKIKSLKGKEIKGKVIKFQQISTAMLVFELIVENSFNGDGHGGFENCMWWSTKKIAEELGASDSVIKSAIHLLREAGVILTLYRMNRHTNQKQYFYFPAFGEIEELTLKMEVAEKSTKQSEKGEEIMKEETYEPSQKEETMEGEKGTKEVKKEKVAKFPFKPNRKIPKPKKTYLVDGEEDVFDFEKYLDELYSEVNIV